ncbi:MAG: hypothetical protein HOB32_11235 [Nitrospina sp.]|jgi:uncharacterized membrane protein|nr:hypothetical protein [Nitrospina sp.]MBT6602207.1 hypothetical protein [Nitrospina sp.]
MFFAKLHPLLVHFPVGLLVSGVLFELYGKFRGENAVAKAGSFNIRFGFWCSIPVAVIGFLGLMSLELKDEFKPFVANHMFFTLSTIFIFFCVILLSRFRYKVWCDVVHYFLLLLGLFTILNAGFYGGELVHRFDLPA